MPLGVLNNISAVYAENNLNETQASLQNVLTQLSSGSRINSGADDPAGLSISNGLSANAAALTQSSANASEGAGFLQVADGALSQVTSLLTSAITLATEAGGGTLSASQMGAANQEYQDILTQIGTIGGTTEYNGIAVFSGDQTTSQLTWAAGAGTPAASASATAAAVAGSSIVAGGTTAGSAPTVTQTYAAPASVAWASGGSGTTLTATFTPGDKLAGTLQFTPTWSSGSPTAISIDESKLDNSSQANLVSSLQAALNTAASGDYTVSAGANNKVIIGIAGSPTDAVTEMQHRHFGRHHRGGAHGLHHGGHRRRFGQRHDRPDRIRLRRQRLAGVHRSVRREHGGPGERGGYGSEWNQSDSGLHRQRPRPAH